MEADSAAHGTVRLVAQRRSDSEVQGAAVVLCGDDAEELGRRAVLLRASALRVAIWAGELDVDAVGEMVKELFPTGADDSVK